MKKLLVSLMMLGALFLVSGCSQKAAAKPQFVCVGCDNLPDCVPGPYGDCPSKISR